MRMHLLLFLLGFSAVAAANPLIVIHTVPVAEGQSAPVLDLYLDGTPLIRGIRYREVLSFANAPAGTRSFSLRTSFGRVLAERALNLASTEPRGHFLALAGDGDRQPHDLIAWVREGAAVPNPNNPLSAVVRQEFMLLSTALEPRVEFDTLSIFPGIVVSPMTSPFTRSLSYGVPAGGMGSTSTPPLIFQQSILDPNQGLISLRLPPLATGLYNIANFVIGNGAPGTPIEWLIVNDNSFLTRGLGSYADSPALPTTRYFGFVGQTGRGLFLEALDNGDRLVGFATGMAEDHGTSWQSLDGQRDKTRQYRLLAMTAAQDGNVGEEWRLRFSSCNDVSLERFDGSRQVEFALLRRGEAVDSCVEFAAQ